MCLNHQVEGCQKHGCYFLKAEPFAFILCLSNFHSVSYSKWDLSSSWPKLQTSVKTPLMYPHLSPLILLLSPRFSLLISIKSFEMLRDTAEPKLVLVWTRTEVILFRSFGMQCARTSCCVQNAKGQSCYDSFFFFIWRHHSCNKISSCSTPPHAPHFHLPRDGGACKCCLGLSFCCIYYNKKWWNKPLCRDTEFCAIWVFFSKILCLD